MSPRMNGCVVNGPFLDRTSQIWVLLALRFCELGLALLELKTKGWLLSLLPLSLPLPHDGRLM